MTNIFQVGTPLPAGQIIGYRRMRKDLKNWAYGPCCGMSMSGMSGTGKTSLAKELHNKIRAEKEKKILSLYLVLNKIVKDEDCDWYSTLLYCIVDELEEALREKDTEDTLADLLDALEDALLEKEEQSAGTAAQEKLQKMLDEEGLDGRIVNLIDTLKRFRTAKPGKMRFRNAFQRIFSTMAEAGWKTCIILDEFDYAAETHTFQEVADFELFRDLCSVDYGVGLLLVSRRELYLIEKKNRNNSVFSGSFNERRLLGFQESDGHDGAAVHKDMTDYYAVLRDNYGIEFTKDEQEELRFYTGWIPSLLSIFGYELAQDIIEGRERQSLRSIYQTKLPTFRAYLDKAYHRIQEYEDAAGVSYIQKLVGIVIGPSIDIMPDDVELLKALGYLQPTNEEEQAYKCISGIFTQYLSHKAVKSDTWNYILETERMARRLIEREFQSGEEPLSAEAWFAILAEAFLRVDNQKELNRSVYLRDIRVNRDSYGVELSVLDVISLKDCFRVIQAYWDSNFADYFRKDQKVGTLDQWKTKFAECGKARNPLAHGNEDFLTDTERSRVNASCQEIIQAMKANMEGKTPVGIPAFVKLPKTAAADC